MSSKRSAKRTARVAAAVAVNPEIRQPAAAQPSTKAELRPRPKPNAPWWVKVFVAFHIAAITIWTLPSTPQGMQDGTIKPRFSDWILVENDRWLKTRPVIQAYLFSTGFWQAWDMFAPDPAQTDYYCDAVITFKDGQTRRYQYPRMALLPISEKYLKERYRKFYERVRLPQAEALWPVFAQRIALLNAHYSANPPVQVSLTGYWRPVAPPGAHQMVSYLSNRYYQYVVDQTWLRRELEAGGP